MSRDRRRPDLRAHGIALAAGAGVWLGVGALTGRVEAWDAPLYWQAGYPALGLVCLAIGVRRGGDRYRVGFTAIAAQLLVMVLRTREFGALLPLGVLISIVLGVPLAALTRLGGRLGRRRDGNLRSPRARSG